MPNFSSLLSRTICAGVSRNLVKIRKQFPYERFWMKKKKDFCQQKLLVLQYSERFCLFWTKWYLVTSLWPEITFLFSSFVLFFVLLPFFLKAKHNFFPVFYFPGYGGYLPPFKFEAVEEGDVRGSCPSFTTRVDVTNQVRGPDGQLLCTLAEAIERYGSVCSL